MTAKKKSSTRRKSSRSSPAYSKNAKKSKTTQAKTASHAAKISSGDDRLSVAETLVRYGILRTLLAVAGVLLLLFATQPGTVPVYSGWPLVSTVLVPVLAPMIFMLLLLDALMGRVLMTDMHGAERDRRRLTVIVNLLLAAGLLFFWSPYYLALGR
jgi:hypothetical protein